MKRKTAVTAVAVFLVTLSGVVALKAHFAPRYSFTRARAVQLARANSTVSRAIRHQRPNVRVLPLDRTQREVGFFRRSKLVAVAAVGPSGVSHAEAGAGRYVSGSKITSSIPVLVGMTLLFAFATASVPLLTLRNLDVLALVAFVPSLFALNRGYVTASVIVAYPSLVYLAIRCFRIGLRPPAAGHTRSLYEQLTSRWPRRSRNRVLSYMVAGAAVMASMITVTSTGASDVAFAALSGATDLLHGVLPYGHVGAYIVHGDTYPPLTYVAYLPAAAIWPVTDLFSDPQGAFAVTTAAILVTAALVYRLGRYPAAVQPERDDSPRLGGLRMTLAWLTFPPVLVAASAGTNDVVLAACVAVALTSLTHPGRSVLAIGAATLLKVVPVLALPVFLARVRGRAALRVVLGLAALSGITCGWMVAIGGLGAIGSMFTAMAFQVERASFSSLWTALPIGFLQPVAIAMGFSCVVVGTAAAIRDSSLQSNPRRVAALLAGIAMVAQIIGNYWTPAYLPWVIVPLLASLLAPAPSVRPRRTTLNQTRSNTAGGTFRRHPSTAAGGRGI